MAENKPINDGPTLEDLGLVGPYLGQVFMEWEIDDHPNYRRGPLWYFFAIVALGGLLIYSVVTANFLFALIVLMLALITYLSSIRQPQKLQFSIAESGVRVGRSFYPYKDIGRFWFIYEPPEVRNLHFTFKNPLQPRITVDLGDQNPNEVRAVLSQFIYEDFTEDEEPFSDYLGRILKI